LLSGEGNDGEVPGVFNSLCDNDDTAVPAIDPAILWKVILFAYSRSIASSRRIAQVCEENVVFMPGRQTPGRTSVRSLSSSP